jgi:hypothetical protein
MPFNQKETIRRIRMRWREGSVSPCFTWPSNEVLVSQFVTSSFGADRLTDQKLPDWKKRIRLGVNATTRLVAEIREFEHKDGEIFSRTLCKSTGNWAYFQVFGDWSLGAHINVIPDGPATQVSQSALAQAIGRAHSDARAKQGALKGSTALAELRDTIRGIRNPALAFRRGIDDYATAARRNARKANGGRSVPRTPEEFRRLSDSRRGAIGRAIGGTWLEHAFGWVPLANDIGDAVIAGIRLSRRVPRARFRGYGEEDVDPNVVVRETSDNGWITRWQESSYQRKSVLVYGAVRLKMGELPYQWAEEFGFEPKDFVPAIWEGIPYSFLVDYFTNVGEIVNALSFPQSDVAWVARTYVNNCIRDGTRARVVRNSPLENTFVKHELLGFVPPTAYWSRRYVDRISYYASLPLPSFQLEIPGSKNWRKWLNMGALALNRLLS